jgi:hypothetical protein
MVAIGTRIDEIGTLIRDGGAFYLRRDVGGRYELELQRTPVDLVEKRVRLIGTLVGPNLVNADGVRQLSGSTIPPVPSSATGRNSDSP